MSIILSQPSDRPGYTFAGTAYWRYMYYRDASGYDPRQSGSLVPAIAFRFSGWVNQAAFTANAQPNDEYELQLTFAEFLLAISPVIASNSEDYIRPIEEILLTKAGFLSGSVITNP